MIWNLSADVDNPDHLYAGTGEAQGQRIRRHVASRGGVWVSRDRGDSWAGTLPRARHHPLRCALAARSRPLELLVLREPQHERIYRKDLGTNPFVLSLSRKPRFVSILVG